MIRIMNLGRSGSTLLRALPCLVALAVLSVPLVKAGRWDAAGAHEAFVAAEKQRAALKEQRDPSISDYGECARTYRNAYLKDPHYANAPDAVYEEGRIYQEMGDRFHQEK